MYACVRMYVCVCICVILKRLYTQVHNVYMCTYDYRKLCTNRCPLGFMYVCIP